MFRSVIAVVLASLCVTAAACDDNPNAPSRADVALSTGGDSDGGTPAPSSQFVGTWEGTFTIDRCTGTGSAQDITCRQRFQQGTPTLMSMKLSGTDANLRGQLTLGDMQGDVTGSASGNTLSLSGALEDDVIRVALTGWSTTRQGSQMRGSFTFRSRARVLPGEATGRATIRVLGRVGS